MESFSEKSVRHGFIRKVYSILTIQLALTLGIVGLFTMESVKKFSAENSWLFIVAIVVYLVTAITLICCEGVRRETPCNYILLGVFTLATGFMLGSVTAKFSVNEVMMAVGVCAAIVFALTLFAFQTKIDFTVIGGLWQHRLFFNYLSVSL